MNGLNEYKIQTVSENRWFHSKISYSTCTLEHSSPPTNIFQYWCKLSKMRIRQPFLHPLKYSCTNKIHFFSFHFLCFFLKWNQNTLVSHGWISTVKQVLHVSFLNSWPRTSRDTPRRLQTMHLTLQHKHR